MSDDQTFRAVLILGWSILVPIAIYYRLRSQATGESLDRRQEGLFILITLRLAGLVAVAGLGSYLIEPSSMAWSSIPLPVWVRWIGAGIGALGAGFLVWTFHTLGKNLTDTVVTRREHSLVTAGPYRFVRHPFYVSAQSCFFANAVMAANWFLLLAGITMFTLLVIRTRTEEEKLLARFGDSYRAYMVRTGRFLPRG